MKKQIIYILLFALLSLTTLAQQRCNFNKEYFDTIADFWQAKFDSTATFSNTIFNAYVNFGEAEFNSIASFDTVQFYSNADFKEAKFQSGANFEETEFNSIANFGEAKFDSIVSFESAQFGSDAYFLGTNFNSEANFQGVEFTSKANFQEAIFHSKANFRNARLPIYLNLSDIKVIDEEIDLTEAYINEKYGICYIDLCNSKIDKIKLRYSGFKLVFSEGIDNDIRYNVYEELLEQQQKHGYIYSYVMLDKDYREFKFTESGEHSFVGGHILNFLNKYWWEYGHKKGLVFRNTLCIFLLFILINTIWFKSLALRIYFIKDLSDIRAGIRTKNKILIFLIVLPLSIFYTALVFFGIKFNINNLKFKQNLSWLKVWRLLYFFVVFGTGLVCLGYLINYFLNN